jgi:hypothetical protein
LAPKNQGVSPTRKATDFFFTKRSNSIKIRTTYDTGVPIQASNSFEFLAEAESFGDFIPLFPGEQVNNGREENCSFFENFSSQFSEKMFKRGIFNKRGIIKLTRIKRFAFVTRFPVGKWPSVSFAIELTNKNSKLVAISR